MGEITGVSPGFGISRGDYSKAAARATGTNPRRLPCAGDDWMRRRSADRVGRHVLILALAAGGLLAAATVGVAPGSVVLVVPLLLVLLA
ncbi:hypothetical protein GCM10010399_56710 [Dactylosporangium fulvum]